MDVVIRSEWPLEEGLDVKEKKVEKLIDESPWTML